MSSLTEIVGGLADQLKTIAELDQNVLTVVRRPATYPAAVIIPPAIPDYGISIAGQGSQFLVPVLILVGTIDAEQQADLLPFLDWTGSNSVAATIEIDRTLGGLDVDARAVSAEAPGLVELPDGTPAYGVQILVQIIAT